MPPEPVKLAINRGACKNFAEPAIGIGGQRVGVHDQAQGAAPGQSATMEALFQGDEAST
ncbi:hypothetical protein [Sphingopyxis sp. BSNA05]|uniref:hypothetical protein n=1 Tax=Sphingopyxis sp. BSNA05 TaxID=1236614 RepID=UPI00349F413B